MIITKSMLPYVVYSEASIREALIKGRARKIRTLFVIDEDALLIGTLSSGDINSWLIENDPVDLGEPVTKACNKSFKSLPAATTPLEISSHFTKRIDAIPLIDSSGHLVSLAFRDRQEITIEDFTIGKDHPAFIVAEIGNNHNGSVDLAKDLVELAFEAGADCAKFQLRDMECLYGSKKANCEEDDLGCQYVLDLLHRFNLTPDQIFEVFDHCRKIGIMPLCTPWDVNSLEALERYNLSAFKIASADMTNHYLLGKIAEKGKPMLVSTGMSKESEIIETINFLNNQGATYALLHCNSTYPTPFKDVNLRYISRLEELSQGVVGYSGHERGWSIPTAAVALGARIVEKHITIDRSMEGNDHKVSLLPHEFRSMVEAIRNTEKALGQKTKRQIGQGEMINREVLAKSLFAKSPIQKGEIITREKIGVVSPGKGLQPLYIDRLIGKTAQRDIGAGRFFYQSDISEQRYVPKKFVFGRPWGIPVRFHDFGSLWKVCRPDFVEYHLSYKDLELPLENFFPETYDIDFIVHAPELFAGDHILNLASGNETYLSRSVENLRLVVEVSKHLRKFFPKTRKPLIVANMGGFTTDGFLPHERRKALYEKICKSIGRIDLSEVELIPQTMPPFPWHFGGQSYHNLFVDPWEIKYFCKLTGMRICLDISHSKLACNYYSYSLKDFVRTVGKHVAHIHIVDAKGTDQEGLQIGEGEIDFQHLGELLSRYCPEASFIPEIWQGHKNQGEGFWKALSKLERLL